MGLLQDTRRLTVIGGSPLVIVLGIVSSPTPAVDTTIWSQDQRYGIAVALPIVGCDDFPGGGALGAALR